LVSCVKYYCR